MGIVNDVIGVFSPKTAARREAWQKRREILRDLTTSTSATSKRYYTGAAGGRLGGNWKVSTAPADEILRRGGRILRDRSHDLVRNNPHAANIVTKHADNIIGDGITPKAKTGDDDLNKKVDELFEEFSRTCDPEGLLNFYGKQRQAVLGMVEGGEILVRRRNRRLSDGLKVPLQIQILEAEYLDDNRLQPYSPRSQNRVENGIEFGLLGDRRGYWLFRQHPSGTTRTPSLGMDSVFVPAAEVAHLFEPKRSQTRGEPWLAPVMNRLQDLDEYDTAERARKRAEACIVGIVTPGDDEADDEDPERIGMPPTREEPQAFDEDGNPLDPTQVDGSFGLVDAYGDEIERFEPGMVYYAKSGSTVEFNTPSSSAGYDTYVRAALKAVAAGARIPYEVITGDLSEVSYASGRMGRVEYQRFVRSMQWNIVIPMLCQPVWNWFVETIKIAGLVDPSVEIAVEWTTPAFQSISPMDDAGADLKEVRAGFMSWDEAVLKRGFDPDVVAQQIVDRNKFWMSNGVILDSDPRFVSLNGQKHQAAADDVEGDSNAAGEQNREEAERTGRERVAAFRRG